MKTASAPNRFLTSRESRSLARFRPGEAAKGQLPPLHLALSQAYPGWEGPTGGWWPAAPDGCEHGRPSTRGGDGHEGAEAEGVEARPRELDGGPRWHGAEEQEAVNGELEAVVGELEAAGRRGVGGGGLAQPLEVAQVAGRCSRRRQRVGTLAQAVVRAIGMGAGAGCLGGMRR
jgi:hypothetical protein